ncbi:hypothetical protein U8527_04835 [Kordia algicida OT-1]|uniref:Uncharacterized protein n=1 Tax=Kordia algicida OT-1 TaxID=391587 RepID=A9DM80_9FLAO|nr:hypothetical protein [Kordia algicida]EDP97646.1 hypothetical protein KAOT1_20827 [Kordia algicida OT-1]
MITFEIIIFISSLVFGISIYWLEAKSNGLYRSINKITNSKELQMKPTNRKGFIVQQEFIPRFIYVNIFFIIVSLIIYFLLPIFTLSVAYYVTALVGTMIGIYIANFIIDVKDKSEEIIDKVVDKSKDIIDDIKTKGQEAAASFSEEETTQEETSNESEAPKKSARERLKDKGLLK